MLVKLALILVASVVLLLQLASLAALADAATAGTLPGEQDAQARLSLVVHAVGGLLVLLATTVLAVYKPRGLTPYGYRRTVAAAARR